MEGEGCNVRGAPTVIDNGINDKSQWYCESAHRRSRASIFAGKSALKYTYKAVREIAMTLV